MLEINKYQERARVFENSVQQKIVMVENFGTEGQKRHFENNNGFKDSGREKPLIRTLQQFFESVESIKIKGVRAHQYKLGAARQEVAERESNNEKNGSYNPSTKHLDALILSHLENGFKKDIEIEDSIINWMRRFGMINTLSYNLYSSKYDKNKREQILQDIQKKVSPDNITVVNASYDFISNDIRNQKSVFKSSLERMRKNKIIETFDRPKAMRLDDKTGLPLNKIDVDMATYKNYTNKKRALRQKYEIDNLQINNYQFEPKPIKNKIDDYNKELTESLKNIEVKDINGEVLTVSISHVWKDLAIIVTATKQKVMEYLHKFHAEVLKDYLEYKEEQYLIKHARSYKQERTSERLLAAEAKKDKNIKYKIADDEHEQNRWDFGKSQLAPDHYEKQARQSKREFMKAIEVLDKSYADNFVIDEDKIERFIAQREFSVL